MRRLLVPAILFASCASAAVAEDIDITVRKTVDSAHKKARVIIINSDGKKTEFQLGKDKIDWSKLKGLPDHVLIRIKKAIAEQAEHEKKHRPVVRTYGKAVIVGADGKKQVIEFGDKGIDEKVLQKLPKNVRIRVEKAIKGVPAHGKAVGKAVIIGADGQKREIEFDVKNGQGASLKGLPKHIQLRIEEAMKDRKKGGTYSFSASKIGTGVFIGPDGKKHVFRFNPDTFEWQKKLLPEMPAKAREHLLSALKNKGYLVKQEIRINKDSKGASSDKLDLILKRLDQLEKQMQELRKKVDD